MADQNLDLFRDGTLGPELQPLVDSAKRYAKASRAPNTIRAYESQARMFARWCKTRGIPKSFPATPQTVALWIADRADQGKKISTIALGLAAISKIHRITKQPDPTKDPFLADIWEGIRRTLGYVPNQKKPLSPTDFRALAQKTATWDDPQTLRNRAMLLVGFAAALRRSELASLRVEDVNFTPDGVEVTVRRSKTDQEGHGTVVGIPGGSGNTDPVSALEHWLSEYDVIEGPLFPRIFKNGTTGTEPLTGRAIASVVKAAAEILSEDPAKFSGHSLRSGFATAAAKAHKPEREIAKQGRWKTRTMIDRYVRAANLFEDNAAKGLL